MPNKGTHLRNNWEFVFAGFWGVLRVFHYQE